MTQTAEILDKVEAIATDLAALRSDVDGLDAQLGVLLDQMQTALEILAAIKENQ
jgi:hypothetical protein